MLEAFSVGFKYGPFNLFTGDEDIMKQKSMDTLAAQMEDFFPVRDVDHLEFYVGNAKQSSYYLARAFGFKIVAYSGLETGNREKVSYVLVQKICVSLCLEL